MGDFEGIFRPAYGQGVEVSVTDVNTSTSFATPKSVVLTNIGSNTAYVSITNGASVASVSDYPLLAGSQVVLDSSSDDDNVNLICKSGLSTTVHFIGGMGM